MHAVVRRDPPGLGLEKSEGNLVRLMREDVRGCVRIYFGRLQVGRNVVRVRVGVSAGNDLGADPDL